MFKWPDIRFSGYPVHPELLIKADLVLDDIAVVFECPATENAITMLKRLQEHIFPQKKILPPRPHENSFFPEQNFLY